MKAEFTTEKFAIATEIPLYLGRFLDEWFADFLSDRYVESMELPCKALISLPPKYARWEFREAHRINKDNPNLVCQALPCFGAAFAQKAAEAVAKVDERKQARLIFSIAKTGLQSVPRLMPFLEHPSANVRAAACLGLAEVVNPAEGSEPAVVLELKKQFLHGPDLCRKETEAFFDKMEALYEPPEAKIPIDAEVILALVRRLEDDYKSVQIAAIETLTWILKRCEVGTSVITEIMTALAKRLEDDYHAIRVAAMEPLALLGVQAISMASDARLYDPIYHATDLDALDKAVEEWAYNGIMDHLRRLSDDPSPDVRDQLGRIRVLGRMAENIPGLSRQDARNLLGTLRVAGAADGHAAAVRQEAVYAMEWWAERWELSGERDDVPEPVIYGPVIPESVLKVQDRVHQLTTAPHETVADGLRDHDIAVRIAALDALVKVFSGGQDVSGDVSGMLNDPCQQVRWRAQRTMGYMVRDKSGAWERYGLPVP